MHSIEQKIQQGLKNQKEKLEKTMAMAPPSQSLKKGLIQSVRLYINRRWKYFDLYGTKVHFYASEIESGLRISAVYNKGKNSFKQVERFTELNDWTQIDEYLQAVYRTCATDHLIETEILKPLNLFYGRALLNAGIEGFNVLFTSPLKSRGRNIVEIRDDLVVFGTTNERALGFDVASLKDERFFDATVERLLPVSKSWELFTISEQCLNQVAGITRAKSLAKHLRSGFRLNLLRQDKKNRSRVGLLALFEDGNVFTGVYRDSDGWQVVLSPVNVDLKESAVDYDVFGRLTDLVDKKG